MTAAEAICSSCGTDLRPKAKFCDECGAATAPVAPAEYKQVTVLFADVVRSMDIAAAVGPERLREIMAELVRLCAAVVQRYGGTVDKFTGDGIMALFGAPKALEDHALRACRAALDVQARVVDLAAEVTQRDGIQLQLRIGLNSGQVIAGEIGAGPSGYTAIGEQVGKAQRMESAAPPGDVLLSESTVRLVAGSTVLADPDPVHIKGFDAPVQSWRLLAMSDDPASRRTESALVGRDWELGALSALLANAVEGKGSVVGVVGPPGIGKSRITREVAALAAGRGVEAVFTYCESHTSDIPFHAAAGLLGAALGVGDLEPHAARERVRAEFQGADADDLLLVDDLLGIGDTNSALPAIDPDARRRRLAALLNAASLARTRPVVYVIEDTHWIDEVSELMLADFLTVIPRTRSLVILTYRPEYSGALARTPRSQTISLEPLDDADISALTVELLGDSQSVASLSAVIAARAAGNPFFAEEIVRDLAERGVIVGRPGDYSCAHPIEDVSVPDTLQSVIAARIDRLDAASKTALNAGSVIGSRFSSGQLVALGVAAPLDALLNAELIDQIAYTPEAEYAFRHPLIRTVAYGSQLTADRAQLHRRVAAAIEQTDANAALIAEHLQAAGDLRAAFDWHMRAGAWSANRDIVAAQLSWERARQVADALPAEEPDRLGMRIAARTRLCTSAWRRFHGDISARFEELRELCTEAGDKTSLALSMAALAMEHILRGRVGDAADLATEFMALAEADGDPTLFIELTFPASIAKLQAGQLGDVLPWTDRVIALTETTVRDERPVFGSPLATALVLRGTARWAYGEPGWRQDLDRATAMIPFIDPVSQATVIAYKYTAVPRGVLAADDAALAAIERALRVAEQCSDDIALVLVEMAYGLTLIHHGRETLTRGYAVLERLSERCAKNSFGMNVVQLFEAYSARRSAEEGDHDGAIERLRDSIAAMVADGNRGNLDLATNLFAETLLERGTDEDLGELQRHLDDLASDVRMGTGGTRDIQVSRLRALLAHARGDVAGYRKHRQESEAAANSLGYEGSFRWPTVEG